jgi:hypothetical protein
MSLPARVRKTGGNRSGSTGSRWNRSGPVHEPVRFPPKNRAYKFAIPVNRSVFADSRKPLTGGFVNLASSRSSALTKILVSASLLLWRAHAARHQWRQEPLQRRWVKAWAPVPGTGRVRTPFTMERKEECCIHTFSNQKLTLSYAT